MADSEADLQGKKVLFVAFFYPPAESTAVPGSMRTVKFVRNFSNGECFVITTPPAVSSGRNTLDHIHLPVNGEQIYRVGSWDVFKFLLKARKAFRKVLNKGNTADTAASTTQNSSVFKSNKAQSERSQNQTQRLKDFIYNLCYFPDQAGPWIIPAFVAGVKIVRRSKIDVIFATGSPWSGLITGYLISKATGKPLIADFRDPWMNNPFHQSKGKILDQLSSRFERSVVRHAKAISLNTQPLMDEFVARYTDIDSGKFFVMPNGFDPADFVNIEPEPEKRDENTLLLCHAGFLYGVRDPDVLLQAIRAANRALATSGKKVAFRQIGDVQLSYDIRERYADLLKDNTLILDAPRPYQECLAALRCADAVVNIQPATQTQIPSKLYDYLGINKPMIHITSRDGALGRLVSEKKIGTLIGLDEVSALTDLLVGLVENLSDHDFAGYESRNEFNIQNISAILAEKFLQIVEEPN